MPLILLPLTIKRYRREIPRDAGILSEVGGRSVRANTPVLSLLLTFHTGVHTVERNEKYTGDMMKLLNSQSLSYVTRKRQQELKKIDGLQSSLHLLDAAPGVNKHTLFLDSKKDGVCCAFLGFR